MKVYYFQNSQFCFLYLNANPIVSLKVGEHSNEDYLKGYILLGGFFELNKYNLKNNKNNLVYNLVELNKVFMKKTSTTI